MATTKQVTAAAETPAEEKEDRVDIFIERDEAEANKYVSVNGVNYILPRGKTSSVPRAVYNEIMRGKRAQAALDALMDELSN